MFFLLYFILNKAALTDLFNLNSSNLTIRLAVFRNLGINIQESTQKHSQLKTFEKLLRDSIKSYNEEKNANKDAVTTSLDYKLNRKKNKKLQFKLTYNIKNQKETYINKNNFVQGFRAPSTGSEKKFNKVIKNSKNAQADLSKITNLDNGSIRKKRSVEDLQTKDKNLFSTHPSSIITTTIFKDFNKDTTVDNLAQTNPTTLNHNTISKNNNLEATPASVLKKKNRIDSYIQKKLTKKWI